MIVGRKTEIDRLQKMYQSSEAEFAVLYGRRRVGKTFLIREFFQNKKCHFIQATGIQKGTLRKQLSHFSEALSTTFMQNVPIKEPESWEEAFKTLTRLIETASPLKKTVIFLDELPWMVTRRSGMLEALDYYWNHTFSRNRNIILIVCGSSASWLIKNIIYNKGGLHNRCTCEIKLNPFNLAETDEYLKSRKVRLNKNHVLQLYMAFGGVPYYLKYVEPHNTAIENIQKILFDSMAPLKDEFKKLFDSLFEDSEAYIELMLLIARKKEGLTRSEIESSSKLSRGGGRLTQRLKQLMQTNFIESYLSLDKARGEYYKVIDEFCLFYTYWLLLARDKKLMKDHWLKQTQKPIYYVWAGYAFEAICYKHIDQIIKALHIKTAENISSWRWVKRNSKEGGAQIDLLINRSDDAITVCEIKYTDQLFLIDKSYAKKLQNKIDVFKHKTKTNKQIFIAMISAKGLKQSIYADELISSVVTLEHLFKED
jgi:AAA+ ATPase superfamily predicted ATPase